jgi:hypothetical protein
MHVVAVANNRFVALILFPSGIVANGLSGFPLMAHRCASSATARSKTVIPRPFWATWIRLDDC